MNPVHERCERAVREALASHAELQPGAALLAPQDDLYDHGLTSLASARVMLAVENELDIEFPEDLLGRELFSSIGRLTRACVELLADEVPA